MTENADRNRRVRNRSHGVDVPEMYFIMIDDASQASKDAVGALFSLSYTLKFMVKKGEMGVDYGVLPLQVLWWSDDPSAFSTGNKDVWKWTVMIMLPKFITPTLVEEVSWYSGLDQVNGLQ